MTPVGALVQMGPNRFLLQVPLAPAPGTDKVIYAPLNIHTPAFSSLTMGRISFAAKGILVLMADTTTRHR